jgi:hypothetical protein
LKFTEIRFGILTKERKKKKTATLRGDGCVNEDDFGNNFTIFMFSKLYILCLK